MASLLLLVSLMCMARGLVAQRQSCENKKDYFGSDIRSILNVANAQECSIKCAEDEDCKSFTYVQANFKRKDIIGKCHLKNPVPAGTTEEGLVSGVKGCFATMCEGNTDYLGDDIPGKAQMNVPSAQACSDLCSKTDGCKSFTYVQTNFKRNPSIHKKCHLKDAAKKDANVKREVGLVSGNKGCSAYDCETNTDFLGNDIGWEDNVESSQACSDKCAARTDCKSFTYVQGNFNRADGTGAPKKRCHFKRIMRAGVNTETGLQSGLPGCIAAPDS